MPYEREDQEAYERTTTHAVARAVAAERERCAKIANEYLVVRNKEQLATEVAAAIRNKE